MCETPELNGQWLASMNTNDVNASTTEQDGGSVVVMPQYRLGVMGFLGGLGLRSNVTGTSGNYGLLDIRLALQWVRQNAVTKNDHLQSAKPEGVGESVESSADSLDPMPMP